MTREETIEKLEKLNEKLNNIEELNNKNINSTIKILKEMSNLLLQLKKQK